MGIQMQPAPGSSLGTIQVEANLFVEVVDAATGEVLERQQTHNLVVNAGLNAIRDFLNASPPTAPTHFATGTGTTAVTATETQLVAQVTREAISSKTTTAQGITYTYYMASTVGNGNTLAEVGLFNAAVSGTMYARALLASTIAKTSSVTVTFTWQVTLAAA